MKMLFTSALIFLTVTAFAQDKKKDTATAYDYGARMYDARIGRAMSVGPNQSKENNPYQFTEQKTVASDTTKWPKEEKTAFLKSCIKGAQASMLEEQAKKYCDCMLEKVIKKYTTPSDAAKMSTEDATKMAKECIK